MGTGRRGSRVAAPSLSSPWAIRPTSARRSGGRLELEDQAVAALELSIGRSDRAEIRDRRGHHQGVEAGRSVGRVDGPQERRPEVGGRLDPDDVRARGERDLDGRRDER